MRVRILGLILTLFWVPRAVAGDSEPAFAASPGARELFIDASALLSGGKAEEAIPLLQEAMLASGFARPVRETLAYAYELAGDFRLANAARLGPAFQGPVTGVPWPMSAPSREPEGLNAALEAAERYFRRRGEKVEPLTGILFGYLDKKFSLPWAGTLIGAYLAQRNSSPYLQSLAPLVDPDGRPHFPAGPLGPMDRDIFAALYCRTRPLPEGFFAQLWWSSLRGGYDLTHAAGALRWAQELGCVGTGEPWSGLQALQIELMQRQAETAPAPGDLFYETIAFLFFTGGSGAVHDAWIDIIVAAQLPEGGWGAAPGAESADDHASLHAFWALLETARPDAPPVPMTHP